MTTPQHADGTVAHEPSKDCSRAIACWVSGDFVAVARSGIQRDRVAVAERERASGEVHGHLDSFDTVAGIAQRTRTSSPLGAAASRPALTGCPSTGLALPRPAPARCQQTPAAPAVPGRPEADGAPAEPPLRRKLIRRVISDK
jgi:hypothetical protein